MRLSTPGVALIKRHEGCRLKAYLCPAGVPTVGYGHTEGVKLGQKISQHQADVILESDLEFYEEQVTALCKGLKLTQDQFDALVSFAFNVGHSALANSTLLKKLRKNEIQGAADEFPRWCKGGGKVLPGLTKRREEERTVFLSGHKVS